MNTSPWRGPSWQVFDADPRYCGQIRRWVSSAITAYGCPADPGDAALCVTELFSNAVLHGPAGGRVLAGYCLWRQGARLIICDGGGPGTPRLRDSGEHAEGGRGLRVVDRLAARWGSLRLAGAQVVWCDLGQPLRAAAGDSWAWLPQVLSACNLSAPAGATPAALVGAGSVMSAQATRAGIIRAAAQPAGTAPARCEGAGSPRPGGVCPGPRCSCQASYAGAAELAAASCTPAVCGAGGRHDG